MGQRMVRFVIDDAGPDKAIATAKKWVFSAPHEKAIARLWKTRNRSSSTIQDGRRGHDAMQDREERRECEITKAVRGCDEKE